MINLYSKIETNFTKNGITILNECKTCKIAEELNGLYELELEYPLDEKNKWQNLVEDNIIKADGQLFRIYQKNKTIKGIKVAARHIFYDLLDNIVESMNISNLPGYNALDYALKNTQYAHSFISTGDVAGSLTKDYSNKNPIEIIMGDDGIINNCGGEIIRDNFEIRLMNTRGLDRGVLIKYGKNIIGIEETLDKDGMCTRMMPIGKDGLLLPEKYIDSPYINSFPHPIIKKVEFNEIESVSELRTAGNDYYIASKCDIPLANYKIDFKTIFS